MSRRPLFSRLSSLIRQIVLTVLFSFSFFLSWYSCRKLNKKTHEAKKDRHAPNHSPHSVGCNGRVSIIIALKNEARYIGKTIRNLENTTIDKNRVEIILVDSGCKDNTFDVARVSKGVIPISEVKFSKMNSSRGAAFNSGAEKACGDILLFLRADSIVPPGYDETLRRQMSSTSNTVLTAFRFDFDTANTSLSQSMSLSLRIIAIYHNIMSSICKLPRGSQALSVSAVNFRGNKYASELLLMEDVAFVDRLREYCAAVGGEITILEQAVRCSSDDIVTIGALKSSLFSLMAFVSWYHLGFSEEFVHKWFYVRIPRALSFYKL